jgi:hypothetical protein
MKLKSVVAILMMLGFSNAFAQGNDPIKEVNKTINKSADHFVFQSSSDLWLEAPDSIGSRIKNTSRGFNVYVMLDKPFKSNPKFSFAGGIGISSSNIFLDKLNAQINGNTNQMKFINLDTTSHFNKYKVSSTFAEIPLELRFCSKPTNPDKAFKFAFGVKAGLLLNAHTKGKTLLDISGKTIQSYTEKIYSKSYFNTSRLSVTGRVGYGSITVFGSYSITSVFKENVAASMKLLQVGVSIGGL